MKKVGEIYATTEYDMFTFDDINRPVDKHNLNRIIESMKDKFLITVSLIVKRNGKNIVWDGQHRLEACKVLGLPYYFTFVDDIDEFKASSDNESLATLQNTKSWMPSDFVHYFMRNGNEDYKKLHDFMEEMDLSCISAVICMTGKIGVSLPKGFKKGTFKVDNIQRAYHLAQIIQLFRKKGYGCASNPKFVSALFMGLNQCSINVSKLVSGVEVNPRLRLISGSTRDTLENLKSYSLKDRPINKQFIAFKNDWPYQ